MNHNNLHIAEFDVQQNVLNPESLDTVDYNSDLIDPFLHRTLMISI